LILLSIRHEKSGRLGDEKHQCHDKQARVRLEDEGDLPRQVRVDVVRSDCQGVSAAASEDGRAHK
jgi:hypothetical protein